MTDIDTHAANVAATMRETMEEIGQPTPLIAPVDWDDPKKEQKFSLRTPFLVSVPAGRKTEDHSDKLRAALLRDKPERRKGTAYLSTLDSLIGWTNRFKGDSSALFADPNTPSLTCIANYHGAGAVAWDDTSGEKGAAFCDHRGRYDFPLSEEWQIWEAVSGKGMDKEELGEFIESNILHFLEPTPYLIHAKSDGNPAPWEERSRDLAEKIGGRFGQPHELMNMSREFTVHETSNLKVTKNRDNGASMIHFVNEHNDEEGRPLQIPNLFLIAIPVFDGGDLYRMTVRFFYRKSGSTVKFFVTLYNPDEAKREAIEEAVAKAENDTALPVFYGTAEAAG
ncbi:DUF2303 family protein [Salipiger abyssi]|uniref:DUF2303 family protein n=1 Tax=Salipiger abyssi TaxID=1250539 RepID=A0A1P8UWE5_9RHOB|nr:DUF2303 family protein [Salipiger abyssi]APZ53711.1 hypothetical protein Ga0080574_TMP3377 [Salipiger abyssi]